MDIFPELATWTEVTKSIEQFFIDFNIFILFFFLSSISIKTCVWDVVYILINVRVDQMMLDGVCRQAIRMKMTYIWIAWIHRLRHMVQWNYFYDLRN